MNDYEEKRASDNLIGHSETMPFEGPNYQIIYITQKILVEYGINPKKISIVLLNSPDETLQALQTLDNNQIIHSLELNLHYLNKYPQAIQEALIRHEIMHLINYDSLEGSYITTMLYELGYTALELENVPAVIAYRHQREFRADLLASYNHPEVARLLQEYFTFYMKITNQDAPSEWTTHPSDKSRHQQLAQLLISMDQPSIN